MQPELAIGLLTLEDLRGMPHRTAAEGAVRARCFAVAVEPNTALCRVLGRYKMYLDTRDTGLVPHLLLDGYWEFWITEFVLRNLSRGQTALDLGAHMGYYTMLMADIVGRDGRVVAFEPNPRLNELLSRNVAVNGYWNVVETRAAAVGDRDAEAVPFVSLASDPKNGRLVPGADARTLAEYEAQGYQVGAVPMVSLDAAIADSPVHFAKIDVEGAEEAVWAGMQGLIARSPEIRIVLEFNPRRCRAPAETLAAIAARFPLRRIGFDGVARACRAEEVLAESEDSILYLSRLDPE
jgi:FkbM family methyltransferase